MSPQDTEDRDRAERVRPNATITTTEAHFEWQQLPSEEREELKRQIREDLFDQAPIEEICRKEIARLIRTGELDIEDISLDAVRSRPDDGSEGQFGDENTMTASKRPTAVQAVLTERPQASLYAVATVMMMAAFYFSSLLLAAAGGLLLVVTTLHYA